MKAESVELRNSTISIAKTPAEFHVFIRGKRPIKFSFKSQEAFDTAYALRVPGVLYKPMHWTAQCTWDAALILAEATGDEDLLVPHLNKRLAEPVPTPGRARYDALQKSIWDRYKIKRREAQASAIGWLIKRGYAILGDPPRGGKCCPLLAVSVLTDAKKTLIVGPAIAKRVWAGEINLWTESSCCMLFGRAGVELIEMCECLRRDPQCSKCLGKGEIYHKRHELESVLERIEWQDPYVTKTGKTAHRTRVAWASVLPRQWTCPKHIEVKTNRAGPCPKCRQEIIEILERTPYIICNYDILDAHVETALRGKEVVRADLPGWAPVLGHFHFDMAICDEIHRVRVWKKKKGQRNRREVLVDVLKGIPRVYGPTGTLTCGFVRDYWGPLDVISDGLWG